MALRSSVREPAAMRRALNGFTLIEVLIAVLVLSLGLLGVATTLLVSVRSAGSNYLKQQAVQYTYDITDRMRANFQVANDPTSGNPYAVALTKPSGDIPGQNCAEAECNATEMAAFDVWQWKNLLKNNLPGGVGGIVVSPTGTAHLTKVQVTINWTNQPVRTSFSGGPVAAVPVQALSVVTAL